MQCFEKIIGILSQLSQVVIAVGTGVLVFLAYTGAQNPFIQSIANHVLSGTVAELESEKKKLTSEYFELFSKNNSLIEAEHSLILEAERLKENIYNLELSVKQKNNDLNHLTEKEKNIQKLLENTSQERDQINEQLLNLKLNLNKQIRTNLFFNAGNVVSILYDMKFIENIYRDKPSNMIVISPKPIMADINKCVDKFASVEKLTWWEVIDCVRNDPLFPWASDNVYNDIVDSDLREIRKNCPRLEEKFSVFSNQKLQNSGILEIVSFKRFSSFDNLNDVGFLFFCEKYK